MMQPLWRTLWRFLRKLKVELPYDSTTLLLAVHPEKTIITKDTCSPMFTAALFIIARPWKQPKCPLTDEWIKKMWHIYKNRIFARIYNGLLLGHKRERNCAICRDVDGPRDCHIA